MKTKDITDSTIIGFDIDKRSWKIHIVTDLFDGSDLTIAPNVFTLQKYVERHFKNYQIYCCYELGCYGFSHHLRIIGFCNGYWCCMQY
ncbi:hypothetical protein ACWGOQ_0011170 [Aquimarina sp. M1]